MATERKQWKGLRWGYDEIIVSPFDSSSCQYCLTVPEVEAILAVTEFMEWTTRWESVSGLEIDQVEVRKFANKLREKLMSCCGEELILHRVNPDTGAMEISTDGGATWQQDPQDPRVSGVQLPPPVTSGLSPDKCNAADAVKVGYSSMIVHLIAQKAASATDAEQAAVITATLTAIFGGAIPAAIVVIFGAIISWLLSADATAMSAAFTETTFAQILCCLACNIGDDGSFSDAQFNSVLDCINSSVTDGYAKTATYGLFKGLGKLGLNNWAASRYSSGADCSGCDCECHGISRTIINGTFVSEGVDTDGHCYIDIASAPHGGGALEQVDIAFNTTGYPSTPGDCAKVLDHQIIAGTPAFVNYYMVDCMGAEAYIVGVLGTCVRDWVAEGPTGQPYTLRIIYDAC